MTDVAWQQTDDLPYSSSSGFYTAPELDYSYEVPTAVPNYYLWALHRQCLECPRPEYCVLF